MPADSREADIERHVGFILSADHVAVRAEECLHQLADQPRAALVAWCGAARLLERRLRPALGQRAPTAARGYLRVELTKKRLIADLTAQAISIGEQALGLEDTRKRRVRVQTPDVLCVVPEDS